MSAGRALTSLLTARTSSLPVAICRIGMGGAAFGRGLKSVRDLYLLQYDPSAVPARVFSWAPVVDTLPEIALLAVVWFAACLGVIVGYRTRLSAAILTACTVLLHVVDQNFWGHHVYFIGLIVFLLAFTETDAALSVRAWRGEGKSEVTWWPVFLMKMQLSLAYFFTGVAKFNPVFLSGHVLARAALPPALLGPGAIEVVAATVVAAELFLSFGLWVPRLRLSAAIVGIALHALVPVLFGFYAGLVVFTVATLSVYTLFVDERHLAWMRRFLPDPLRTRG